MTGLFEVELDVAGQRVLEDWSRCISGVCVLQRLSLPSVCEITFTEPPREHRFQPGAPLRIGQLGHSEPLFEGEISGVDQLHQADAARQLRLRAQDRLHGLRRREPVRAHVQVTLRELAQELVAPLGLQVHSTAAGPLWPHLVQHGISDFALLVDLCQRAGFYFLLQGDRLELFTLEGRGPEHVLRLGRELWEAELSVSGRAAGEVRATAWSPLSAEHFCATVRAGDSALGSARTEDRERTLINLATRSEDEAELIARAELDVRRMSERVLRGIAEGNVRLRPGARVRVEGVDAALSGPYVLTSVTHRLNAEAGFLSEVSSVPPPRAVASNAASLSIGEVSRVDDPEGQGRVRVSLLTSAGVETDWMQVLSPGAGAKKGWAILPDVGDRVLLAQAGDDPAKAVVLGGLYGVVGAHDPGVRDGTVHRYTLRTPSGHLLRFDDAAGSVRLENGHGSFLELGPEGVTLRSQAPLTIEAPGQPLVIGASSIDFQRRG